MSRRKGSDHGITRLVLLTLAFLMNGTALLHAQTPENLNRPPRDEDYLRHEAASREAKDDSLRWYLLPSRR